MYFVYTYIYRWVLFWVKIISYRRQLCFRVRIKQDFQFIIWSWYVHFFYVIVVTEI